MKAVDQRSRTYRLSLRGISNVLELSLQRVQQLARKLE
jgi:hypothetical protein